MTSGINFIIGYFIRPIFFEKDIKRSNEKEEFSSIKTVKSNLDQTEVSKRDI